MGQLIKNTVSHLKTIYLVDQDTLSENHSSYVDTLWLNRLKVHVYEEGGKYSAGADNLICGKICLRFSNLTEDASLPIYISNIHFTSCTEMCNVSNFFINKVTVNENVISPRGDGIYPLGNVGAVSNEMSNSLDVIIHVGFNGPIGLMAPPERLSLTAYELHPENFIEISAPLTISYDFALFDYSVAVFDYYSNNSISTVICGQKIYYKTTLTNVGSTAVKAFVYTESLDYYNLEFLSFEISFDDCTYLPILDSIIKTSPDNSKSFSIYKDICPKDSCYIKSIAIVKPNLVYS